MFDGMFRSNKIVYTSSSVSIDLNALPLLRYVHDGRIIRIALVVRRKENIE
jgi:hypothetical protein